MNAASALEPYVPHVGRSLDSAERDLESFVTLLLKWNRTHNLVSRETTAADLWSRHVRDRLQVLKYLRPSDREIIDIGSGGGFPAVPLAIASDAQRRFQLIEPNSKKASFLRTVSRELGLDLVIHQDRAESIVPSPADVVTSRALAPLAKLCALAAPFFGPATRALFHKGREHVDELAESHGVWHHDVVVHASDTDSSGVLLELSNLRSR